MVIYSKASKASTISCARHSVESDCWDDGLHFWQAHAYRESCTTLVSSSKRGSGTDDCSKSFMATLPHLQGPCR